MMILMSNTITDSITFEENVAYSTAKTVGEAITKASEWYEAVEWSETYSRQTEEKFTLCPEIEYAGVKLKIFEYSNGETEFDEETTTEETAITISDSSTVEKSSAISSTVSYTNGYTRSVDKSWEISPEIVPYGKYIIASVCDAKVFAIVTYAPKEGKYYLDTYTMVSSIGDTILYDPSGYSDVDIVENPGLVFYIPGEQILEMVESSYYVKYDANGGEGEMLMSAHTLGGSEKLNKNTFTKVGYTFDGWTFTNDDTLVSYSDGAIPDNLADSGEIVTLYAQWMANEYNIKYDDNKPTEATNNVQNMPSETSCRYNEDVTLASEPSLMGWTFDGWYDEEGILIGDAGEKLEKTNFCTSQNGDETKVLYAKWEANTHTVTFDANGGSVNTKTKNVSFDHQYGDLPAPSRSGYAFGGWMYGTTIIDKDSFVSINESHTLKARWIKTKTSVVLGNGQADRHTIRIWSTKDEDWWGTDVIQTDLNRDELLNLGYSKINVSMTFNYRVDDWGSQLIQVFSNRDQEVTRFQYEWKECGWSQHTVDFSLSLKDHVDSACGFWLKWYLWQDESFSDTWFVGGTTLSITAV